MSLFFIEYLNCGKSQDLIHHGGTGKVGGGRDPSILPAGVNNLITAILTKLVCTSGFASMPVG